MTILLDYLKLIGWGAAGILTMAISLWVLLSVFTWLTPVDEWAELKKEPQVAIVMASVIIGFALVISSAIAPPPVAP